MSLNERAEGLRQTFRDGFARAQEEQRASHEELLAFRIRGDPYAVFLSEVAALHADRKVVRVPSAAPELLGLAALRGSLAPVYALGHWLGYPDAAVPRWLMLAAGATPVWLAIDLFEGQLRVDRAEVSPETRAESSRCAHLRGAVRTAAGIRSIVHLASVLEAIAGRVSATRDAR